LWDPYQSGRQWGTVREDYSANGDAWSYLPFDQAHSRAYRWGEDGIGGLCDGHGFLHLSAAVWNGRDERLKERWFGLTKPRAIPNRDHRGRVRSTGAWGPGGLQRSVLSNGPANVMAKASAWAVARGDELPPFMRRLGEAGAHALRGAEEGDLSMRRSLLRSMALHRRRAAGGA